MPEIIRIDGQYLLAEILFVKSAASIEIMIK